MSKGSIKLVLFRYGESAYVKKAIKMKGRTMRSINAFQSLNVNLKSFARIERNAVISIPPKYFYLFLQAPEYVKQ